MRMYLGEAPRVQRRVHRDLEGSGQGHAHLKEVRKEDGAEWFALPGGGGCAASLRRNKRHREVSPLYAEQGCLQASTTSNLWLPGNQRDRSSIVAAKLRELHFLRMNAQAILIPIPNWL